MVKDHNESRFSSRIGMLLSVLGIAVGTGNIWRFPRIAAQSSGDEGAGAFLLVWLFFLLVWSIPLIIAEYAMGQKGRMGVVGTFVRIAGERFAWMGAFVGFVATAIMFYYSVVAGWCMYYLYHTATSAPPTTTAAATAVWENFQGGSLPVLFHAAAMGFGAVVVLKGVSRIEKVSKVLIPTLLAIVLISLVRAVTLDGAWDGIRFLFTPSWDTLAHPRLYLEALTQNAWDTGAGWGLILTYGAYMHAKHGVVKNGFITGFGNNAVSILAAITIFGTVFAILGQEMSDVEVLEVMRSSGPASTGLTFIWLPQLFSKMPFGGPISILFFAGLSFAAFTSLVSMIELAVRAVTDLGVARPQAVGLVVTAGFVMGLPSAYDLGILENQDFVWGVALMISGAMVSFALIRYGVDRIRLEIVDATPGDWKGGRGWALLVGGVVPVLAIVLLAWWLYQSAAVYAPDTWYDPFDPYSVMTCLVQWGAAAVFLIAVNRRLAARTMRFAPKSDDA